MRRDQRVHVAFDAKGHRYATAPIVAHWRPRAREDGLVEDALTAFTQLARCVGPLDVVIAADSLLNQEILTQRQIDGVLSRTARGRRMLRQVDGRAESGTETIVRTRLRARGVQLRTQVSIAAVGRVDLVVGDRLVIEVDGREWHDTESQFELDRARDARLIALGYLVMRFSFQRVMREMPEVERQIMAVVRARDHMRVGRHDRIRRNYG
jgi:very-short-patch-repair endonuclease